ncbi:hypothetical protein C8J57DRAFT_1513968 [Mycena rebaudengoi]|nr:hypothetical protein C8J57DRAFT_1513968 [Mycena rebaudengoi]
MSYKPSQLCIWTRRRRVAGPGFFIGLWTSQASTIYSSCSCRVFAAAKEFLRSRRRLSGPCDVLGRLCDAPAARSAGASYSIFYLPRYIPALMTRLRSGAPPRTLILMNARAFDFYAPWDTPHLPSTSHHSPAALRTAAESPTRLVAVLDVLPPPSSNERAALSQVLQRALGTQRRTRLSNSRCPLPVNSTMHHHHL